MSGGSNTIVNNIVAALARIREDAGFHQTVQAVREGPLDREEIGAFPALSVQIMRVRTVYYPAKRRKKIMRVQILGLIRPPAGTDKFEAARELIEDIESALAADMTRGGSATKSEVRETRIEAAAHEEGARVSCVAEITSHESF
jgi:hypothetical protein